MAEILETRELKIPPCKINKNLIKKIGDVIETESPKIYDELFDLKKKELSESDYYKKYPEKLDKEISSRIYEGNYLPSYLLASESKIIKSHNIEKFIETKWPTDALGISLSIGSYNAPKRIEIEVYLKPGRMEESKVSVSGRNSIWVNGVIAKIEGIFQEHILGYHFILDNLLLKIITLIITWFSISYAILNILWPYIQSYLKAGVKFEYFFPVIFIFLGLFTIPGLYIILQMLFPYLEFGEKSISRQIRKWIWILLMGSGLIWKIIFRALGID